MIKIILFTPFLILEIYLAFKNAEQIICRPPNKFVQVFAPPGTGKTTEAANLVRDSLKTNKPIYSNVPIRGAYKLDLKDIGRYLLQDCTLIIDEAGSELSNRNWMHNLSDSQIRFLKKHRHYGVDIWLFSQAYNDVDNKFRELTTRLIMLKKSRIPFKINALAIKKNMDLINGQIVEFFEWDKENSFSFFNPKTWAYFNSYDMTEKYETKVFETYTQLDTI